MAGDIAKRGRVEAAGSDELPLCVDLDGTLVRTDTLHEQYLIALMRRPFAALLAVVLLLRGKAAFKQALGRLGAVHPASLPYQMDLLEFLRQEKVRGRTLVLATASDRNVAEPIAAHLG